jgi:hypothetical protein
MPCFMCNGNADNGIILMGKQICCLCEEEIVSTSIYSYRYFYHLERIKDLWMEYLESGKN